MNARARTLFGDSPIADLLAMIERCAPRLMRAGGGSLSECCGEIEVVRRLTDRDRDQIVAEYLAGWNADFTASENTALLTAIADRHGLHYGTIARITRAARRERGIYFSRNSR